MPIANGNHYPYKIKLGSRYYGSSGKTYTRTAADKSAKNIRKRGRNARVVRLGKSDRFAIYTHKSRRQHMKRAR